MESVAMRGWYGGWMLLWPMVSLAVAEEFLAPGDEGVFCQNEDFRAQCGPDEVVQMTSAHYGRMKLSNCVHKNYGNIGCNADVIGVTDLLCSGRRHCSVDVPNEHFDATRPCPEDFKNYFAATYHCLPVMHVERHLCSGPYLLEAPSGVLASVVTTETGCGSANAPWLIEALPGQRIHINLTDFSHVSGRGEACVPYANLKEVSVGRRETLCGRGVRDAMVYESRSHSVQVIVLDGLARRHRYFLLKYRVTGCATPAPPPGAWVSHQGERATFGCNGTDTEWTWSCNGSHWAGKEQRCSAQTRVLSRQGDVPFLFTMSYEMAVVVIVAIALVVASIILCMGVICLKRVRHNQTEEKRRERELQYAHQESPYPPADPKQVDMWDQYRLQGENVYASIQDWPIGGAPGEPPKQCLQDPCTCPRDPNDQSQVRAIPGTYSSLEHTMMHAAPPGESHGVPVAHDAHAPLPRRDIPRQYYILDPRDSATQHVQHST